jgi:CHRD domain
MKKLLTYSFLMLLILIFSCKKEDDNIAPVTPPNTGTTPDLAVTTTLIGENEVPFVVATKATGSVTGTYNKTTKILTITLTYKDLIPFGIHIHKAAAGKLGGGIIFDFEGDLKSPYTYTKTLLGGQEVELLAGNYYVNIHTDKAPDGEIRGNLTVK